MDFGPGVIVILNTLTIKDLFPHEANDFTPWLAKNRIIPTILEYMSGKPYQFWKREVKVSNYRLDMIYQAKDKSEAYIVENQYGLSDNKHLGQIVVYRYLTKIKKVLWICDQVSLEHQHTMRDMVDVECLPCSVEIHELPGDMLQYQFIFRVYSKKERVKFFIFNCDANLEHVTLKKIT